MTEIEEEVWRAVRQFPEFYEVSSYGRVRSLERTKLDSLGRARTWPSVIYSPKPRDDGYEALSLRLPSGKRWDVLVHFLVCEAWHGPRPPGADVRHLDGDPSRSIPTNLAWGTRAENMQDMIRHGRTAATEECPRGHLRVSENRKHNGECRACAGARDHADRHPDDAIDVEAEANRRYLGFIGELPLKLRWRERCKRGHRTDPPNVTNEYWTRGVRKCLACARAHGWTQHRSKENFQAVADRYYREIMGEEVA